MHVAHRCDPNELQFLPLVVPKNENRSQLIWVFKLRCNLRAECTVTYGNTDELK